MLPDAEIIAYNGAFIPIEVGHYPGGEPIIKDVPKGISALIVRPRGMDSLMAGLFLAEVMLDRQSKRIDLIIPYFPGARQDRLLSEGDKLLTVRSIGRIISDIDSIERVKVLDPHSSQVERYLWKHRIYSAAFVWGWDTPETPYAGVIAPDKGAIDRAIKVADYLDIDRILFGRKRRDPVTGKLTGFELEGGESIYKPGGPSRYLVVDDICDGGGTFLGLADELDRYSIKADLYVTHGIFSKGTEELLKRYGKIYCSDSIVGEKPGVQVIRTVERMV